MVGDGGVEPQWAPPGLVLPKAYKTPAGDISHISGGKPGIRTQNRRIKSPLP